MAAKTTVRVAITNNAAKDDSFSGSSLDWLSENGSLSGSLNVLGNDPGSATLYGVHSDLPTGTGQIAPQASSTFAVVYEGTTYNGTLTVNPDGTVGFDLSALSGHLDSLAEGESVSVTFYYTSKMANGALSTAKVTIELTGSNDAPVATAETITVFEDGALATGHVDASDIDHGAVLTYALAGTAPAGFSFNTDGSYSFDPSVSAYQHLAAGAEDTFSVDYTVTDEHGASSTATISFTVTGVNDPASISGDSDGAVSEDDVISANGTLAISDVDDGEAHTEAGSQSGAYGDFTVDADGNWSYDLDHDLANSLQGGEEQTETFTVTSLDGTASQDVTITVTGTNDAATFGGAASGDAYEDGVITASGALTVSDADHDESSFEAQTGTSGSYGAFSIDSAGNWSYTLDSRADALNDSDVLTETFAVASADGTTTSVTVTVHGHTDVTAPVLSPVQGYDPNNQDPNNYDPNGTSANNAHLNGNSSDNTIYGGAGNDALAGQGGNDSLFGGSGNDQLNGQGQNDTLYGGDGSDNLNGQNDNDVLIGGYGADNLTGNNGADVFTFLSALDRGDSITDFDRTQGDTINVDALNFTGGFQASATSHGLWQDGAHVYGDTDGNVNTIEFYFDVNTTLQASDFVL